MAHQFIPFRTGSDEREHDLVSEAPVRLVFNGEHETAGGISKRKGFEALETSMPAASTAGGTLLSTGRAWGVLRSQDFRPANLATVLPASEGLTSVANHFRIDRMAEVTDGVKLTKPHLAVMRLTDGGPIAFVVAARSSTSFLLTVIALDTGTVLHREVITDHADPIVVPCDLVPTGTGNFAGAIIIARNTSTSVLDAYSLGVEGGADLGNDVVVDGPTAVTSAITAGSVYDVIADPVTRISSGSTEAVVACRDNATNNLVLKRVDFGLSVTASISQAVTGAAPHRVNLAVDDAGAIHVIHGTGTTAPCYLETFASDLSSRTLGSTLVFNSGNVSQAYVCNLAGSTQLMLTSHGADLYKHAIIDTDHTDLSSVTSIASSTFPCTKPVPIRYGTAVARPFVGIASWDAVTRRTFFPTAVLAMIPRGSGLAVDGYTASSSGYEFGGYLWTDAHDVQQNISGTPNHQLPGWTSDSRGDYYIPIVNVVSFEATGFTGSGDTIVAQSSIAVVRVSTAVDHASSTETALPKLTDRSVAYVGGAALRFFDGVNFGEVVPAPPQTLTLTQGVGSNLAAGVYSYCAILTWEDAAGNLHRSAPSEVVSRTHAGTNGIVAALKAYFPTMLDLDAGGQKWRAELYRTEAGGSTFYYQQSAEVTPYSTVTFTEDTTTDAVLATHRTLYTTGDRLENRHPPAVRAMCVHRGRMWLLSAQDPHILYFSQVFEERIAPEFNPALTVRLDQPGVALASLDDKLVVFTERDAVVILGEGPDASGGGAFSTPELITGPAGATGPKAAVSTPFGILVHSPAGFQLLGRDLSVQDADFLAESWGSDRNIGAVLHHATAQQVWFFAERPCATDLAVFDYSGDSLKAYLWEFAEALGLHAIRDVADVGGVPYVLARVNTDDTVVYKRSDNYADVNEDFPVEVTTGWFAPDGWNGDCRFRRVAAVGQTPSGQGDATLQIDAYVQKPNQSNSTPVNQFEFSDLENPGAPRFHRRGTIKRQRGIAARAVVRLTADSSAAGPVLTGVDWDYATRGAPAKQAPSRATL